MCGVVLGGQATDKLSIINSKLQIVLEGDKCFVPIFNLPAEKTSLGATTAEASPCIHPTMSGLSAFCHRVGMFGANYNSLGISLGHADHHHCYRQQSLFNKTTNG